MNTRNFTVGLFLIGGTALFATGLFLLGNRQRTFARHFEVYAEFASVSSLQEGAFVRVSGLDAGEVRDIAVPDKASGRFRLKLRLDQKMQPLVRQDSTALILTEGLVGNKYLEIEKGTDAAPECTDGCTIPSQEPFDMSDLLKDARGLMESSTKMMDNASRVANNLDRAVGSFVAKDSAGRTGAEDLRATARSAQQAMSSLADDAEALKHNFLFRGFFNKRGYYNLNNLTVTEYRKSKFVKGSNAKRVWLDRAALFTAGDDLTAKGRSAIDDAMGTFGEDLRNNPVVVEGYANDTGPDDRYRRSLKRATTVQQYIEEKFHLEPKHAGAIPLGATPPAETGKDSWDGVSVVLLPKK